MYIIVISKNVKNHYSYNHKSPYLSVFASQRNATLKKKLYLTAQIMV